MAGSARVLFLPVSREEVSVNLSRNWWSSSSCDKVFLGSFLICIAIMPVSHLTLLFQLLFATVVT